MLNLLEFTLHIVGRIKGHAWALITTHLFHDINIPLSNIYPKCSVVVIITKQDYMKHLMHLMWIHFKSYNISKILKFSIYPSQFGSVKKCYKFTDRSNWIRAPCQHQIIKFIKQDVHRLHIFYVIKFDL